MSDFAGEGFSPFPNVYEDNKRVASFSEMESEALEYKVEEYWLFLRREDLMPRAQKAAHRILEHLGFELDYRAGCYEEFKYV